MKIQASVAPTLSQDAEQLIVADARQYLDLSAQIKALEAQKRSIGQTVLDSMELEGVDKAEIEGIKFTVIRGESNKLDVEMLLKAGVDWKVINACTRTTQNRPFVKISGGKDE